MGEIEMFVHTDKEDLVAKLYICDECGAAVLRQDIHDDWHERHSDDGR